ncbi:MAG: hypothetical protein AAGJ38_02750 [Planctomycetota bacterium]
MARARRLSDEAALNLDALTSNRGTGLVHVSRTKDWAADCYRRDDVLDALAAATLANQFRVYLTETDAGVAIEDALGCTAGVCNLSSTDLDYAGSTQSVTGLSTDDTYFIYAESDGGAPAAARVIAVTDAVGWPGTAHLKLATVTRTAGVLAEPDRSVFYRRLLTV